MVVPESVEDISSNQLRRMWDSNVRDDMRVREVVSSPTVWLNDEVAGCIARLETTIPFVDVVQEVVLSENRDAEFFLGERQTLVNSPAKPLKAVANASLSDLDFANRNRGILKEAHETLDLGRLIGANTIGNKEEIVKDIARIIAAREKKQ
ncbi:hypothetical protein V6N13_103668 [Hibiscus sabdariffa]